MSSFFPRQFLPPKTIACRGLCQLQVLLAADAPASLPFMPNLKTRFLEKTGLVRSIISALIAIG